MGKVKFGDIVREVKLNVDRTNNPYEFYVAGDHMDGEDLTIRRRGRFETDDVGPAFTRIFKPGQILYGSRRTYLKKVAVADFEGICSNTTFILESKDPNVFCQELLPFIMLSEAFTKWSVSHSKGSTNPYVLFSDLAGFTFDLPSLDEQKVLADKLWAAYRVKESYRKLLAATDDMVKAKFVEMFGDPMKNTKEWSNVKPLGECTKIVLGSTPKSNEQSFWDGDLLWITPAEMSDDKVWYTDTDRHITEDGKKSTHLSLLPEGAVLFSTRAPIGKVGIVSKPMYCNQGFKNFICNDEINNYYLYYSLLFKREHLQTLGTGSTFKELSKGVVEKLLIAIPPMDLQHEFAAVFTQAEATKASLRQSIESIDRVIKSLINQ